MPQLLHNHKEFNALISIVASNMSIAPALVEKDYWIMHCLYGLQKMNLTFELKGGTSLTTRNQYREAYENTQALYYKTQPQFDRIIDRIQTAFALGL